MSIVWRVSYAALITAIIVVRSSSPAADAADIINDSSVASAVFLSKLVVILLGNDNLYSPNKWLRYTTTPKQLK